MNNFIIHTNMVMELITVILAVAFLVSTVGWAITIILTVGYLIIAFMAMRIAYEMFEEDMDNWEDYL